MPRTRRLTARLKAELGSIHGKRGGAAAKARREALKAAGLTPPRVYVRPTPSEAERRIVKCLGVPAVGRNLPYSCPRRVLQGRIPGYKSARCGRCRVMDLYRRKFSDADPEVIVGIIQELAAAGLIGKQSKRKSRVKTREDFRREREAARAAVLAMATRTMSQEAV